MTSRRTASSHDQRCIASVILPTSRPESRASHWTQSTQAEPTLLHLPRGGAQRRDNIVSQPVHDASGGKASGKERSASQPRPPLRFASVRVPLCASAIWRDRASPIPEPLALVV